MKLSIIVPLYNCEKYIGECIESLLKQKIKKENYEIIVINDGSVDGGEEIVKKYLDENKNISLINQENGGVSKARNKGIRSAKGEYLFFVDGDDYIAENVISDTILDNLKESKNEILFFDMKRVLDVKKEAYAKYSSSKFEKSIDGRTYFKVKNVNNGPWHYFIKRKYLIQEKILFKEDRFCEDGIFLLDILFNAKKVSYIKSDIYRYVVRENSTTTTKDKKKNEKIIDDFMFAIKYIDNYAKKIEADDDLYKKVINRRNSYIFFMQARMIKNKVGKEFAKKAIEELEDSKCFKYGRLSSDYSGIKYTILGYIFNSKILFLKLCS